MSWTRFRVAVRCLGVVLAVLFGAAMVVYQFCPADTHASSTKPERVKNKAPGDCAACHRGDKVLPANHAATATMDGKGCNKCHKEGKTSLRGKIPLSHTHDLNGVTCEKCHGAGEPPKAVMTDQCLGCHGTPEGLAKKTQAVKPNPHNNPHQGTSLDCDVCHHQHTKSENYCRQCHMFKYVVP